MLMCKGENKHEKQTTKGDDFWTKGWVVSLPYFCFLHHRAGYNVFDSSQWCSWWMWECHGGLRCGVGMLQNNISGNATHSEGFVPHPSRRINSHPFHATELSLSLSYHILLQKTNKGGKKKRRSGKKNGCKKKFHHFEITVGLDFSFRSCPKCYLLPSCHHRCHTISSSKRQTKEEIRNEEVGRK